MSIPGIALAAVFVSILGISVPSIIFAIGFMYTPQIARIVRANIVSEYGEDYVRAVIVSGAMDMRGRSFFRAIRRKRPICTIGLFD